MENALIGAWDLREVSVSAPSAGRAAIARRPPPAAAGRPRPGASATPPQRQRQHSSGQLPLGFTLSGGNDKQKIPIGKSVLRRRGRYGVMVFVEPDHEAVDISWRQADSYAEMRRLAAAGTASSSRLPTC